MCMCVHTHVQHGDQGAWFCLRCCFAGATSQSQTVERAVEEGWGPREQPACVRAVLCCSFLCGLLTTNDSTSLSMEVDF